MSTYRTVGSVPYHSALNRALVLAEAPPRRPHVITFAAASMILTAGLGLLTSIAAYSALDQFKTAFRPEAESASAGQPVSETGTTVQGAFIAIAVAALACSIVLVLLTSGVLRGNRGARLGVWVLSAVGTAAAGVVGLTMIFVRSLISAEAPTAASSLQIAREAIPPWYPGVAGLLALLQALGFIATAMLLSAPPAAAFYRRVMLPWRPDSEPH